MADSKANAAWERLFGSYNIEEDIQRDGFSVLDAATIKQFREPRLMAKWDSSEDLPSQLSRRNLNILPISRSSYEVSDFQLYQKFPEDLDDKVQFVNTPNLETIDFDDLTSESNAINAMNITGILDDFLRADRTVETFNGRMGTKQFSFDVDLVHGGSKRVNVNSAQLEIDGGFENDDSIVIMEAKNVPHPDFHVRQLYFPYRLWQGKVKKNIRLVFSQYVDSTYHLFEYSFDDPENYSSIRLLRQANYSFQSSAITWDDLHKLWDNTRPVTDDNQDQTPIPFIQADHFPRLISLIEKMSKAKTMTAADIALYMEFDIRQSSYYASAGKYLEIIENAGHGHGSQLTVLGQKLMLKKIRDRRLELVRLIIRHQIFHDFLASIFECGELPSRAEVKEKMLTYNVCAPGETLNRRASSVLGWLRWISMLPTENDE
ncbi:type II restriction enzyme [Bifidobacterium aquikefiricola]|uniref:Type II restriction endonuclease n=1 Tax=Bifidobacterium aquikefiricola TaxID=3059038 RepID=A0AB39U7Q2_9BIFI